MKGQGLEVFTKVRQGPDHLDEWIFKRGLGRALAQAEGKVAEKPRGSYFKFSLM